MPLLREQLLQVIPVPAVCESGIRNCPITRAVLVSDNLEPGLSKTLGHRDLLLYSRGTACLRAEHNDEFVGTANGSMCFALPILQRGRFLQRVIRNFERRGNFACP